MLFTRLDRFSRNVGAYYSIVDQMNGVPWKAVLEDFETETPDGVFKVNIMLSVAQSEADKTAARLKDSYQYRKAKGIFYGKAPTGYTVEGGKLIKDPKTKDGVQAMFNTYLKTLSAAKTIQVAGEYGIPLYKTSLKKILKNQTYCGMTENGHGDWLVKFNIPRAIIIAAAFPSVFIDAEIQRVNVSRIIKKNGR